jgi:hypothetical protein
MHTYSKEKDGTFAVGQWLNNSLEFRFVPLFYVASVGHAIAATCMLNGAADSIPDELTIVRHADHDKKARGVPSWAYIVIGMLFGALMQHH